MYGAASGTAWPTVGGSGYGGSGYGEVEQFGARAIRELVNVAPKIAEAWATSPEKIVAAIAAAKDKGLTALAEKLEAKLLGLEDHTHDTPVLEAPPSAEVTT
jgi:hypothetical protein